MSCMPDNQQGTRPKHEGCWPALRAWGVHTWSALCSMLQMWKSRESVHLRGQWSHKKHCLSSSTITKFYFEKYTTRNQKEKELPITNGLLTGFSAIYTNKTISSHLPNGITPKRLDRFWWKLDHVKVMFMDYVIALFDHLICILGPKIANEDRWFM